MSGFSDWALTVGRCVVTLNFTLNKGNEGRCRESVPDAKVWAKEFGLSHSREGLIRGRIAVEIRLSGTRSGCINIV